MSATKEPVRGYAWHPLPCGHAIAWDRLGPLPPCRECDAEAWRAWAVAAGLVTAMAERSGA